MHYVCKQLRMKSMQLLSFIIFYYAICTAASDSFHCLKVTAYPLSLNKLNGTRYISDIANRQFQDDPACGYATYVIDKGGKAGKEIRSVFDKIQKKRTFTTYFVKEVLPGINEKTSNNSNIVSTATVLAYEQGKFDINYICERQNGVDIRDRFSLATVNKNFTEEEILKAYESIGPIPEEFTHRRVTQKNCDISK